MCAEIRCRNLPFKFYLRFYAGPVVKLAGDPTKIRFRRLPWPKIDSVHEITIGYDHWERSSEAAPRRRRPEVLWKFSSRLTSSIKARRVVTFCRRRKSRGRARGAPIFAPQISSARLAKAPSKNLASSRETWRVRANPENHAISTRRVSAGDWRLRPTSQPYLIACGLANLPGLCQPPRD